jgi:predicted transcriptional regulator
MTDLETLADLIEQTTAARGVDLWVVEQHDPSARQWAEMTGRDASTVQRNVRRARRAD